MSFWVGTSGWQYKDWKGRFYPAEIAQSRWLSSYAQVFDVVEVNNTFYQLPKRETFQAWMETVADTPLQFVIKASRYLTHVRRLKDPEEPVARLMDRSSPLGTRLAAVLVQLPPSLEAEPARLDATLAAFSKGSRPVRVAVEPRHASWFHDEVYDVLRRHDAALCWTDRRNRVGPTEHTAGWGYVRLHEGVTRTSAYGDDALRSWASRLEESWPEMADVYVFFNNDHLASAPHNACQLVELLRSSGRDAPAVGVGAG